MRGLVATCRWQSPDRTNLPAAVVLKTHSKNDNIKTWMEQEVPAYLGRSNMIYYTIKCGVTVEIQLFGPEGQIIDIFDYNIENDKTFNENFLLNMWDCPCCDKNMMSFYMGSSVFDGMEVRQCVVVCESYVISGNRDSITQKRTDKFSVS